MTIFCRALLTMCVMAGTAAGAQTAGVQLYAAGSLREALTEVARDFETASGHKVVLTFGASGLLRLRVIQVPDSLQVAASNGVTVRREAGPGVGAQPADYLLAPAAQALLWRHGFGAPGSV